MAVYYRQKKLRLSCNVIINKTYCVCVLLVYRIQLHRLSSLVRCSAILSCSPSSHTRDLLKNTWSTSCTHASLLCHVVNAHYYAHNDARNSVCPCVIHCHVSPTYVYAEGNPGHTDPQGYVRTVQYVRTVALTSRRES